MTAEEKLELITEVVEETLQAEVESMESALLDWVQAVTTGIRACYFSDEDIIEVWLDLFEDDHPVWSFVTIEE